MSIARLRSLWDAINLPDFSSDAWRGVLIAIVVVGYALGIGYQLLTWATGSAPALAWRAGYHISIVLCYSALWFLFSSFLRRTVRSPVRLFLYAVLAGVAYLVLASLVQSLGTGQGLLAGGDGSVAGLDYERRVPLTIAAVVKVNLLSLLEVTFTMLTLLLLRNLVFYRRTRSSQFNWRLMMGFFVLTALLTFMKNPADDLGGLMAVAMIPAVGMAVVNAFRLSWIVYLPFREKMATMGLALVLMVLLGFSLGDGVLPDVSSYTRFYSFPLSVFALLAALFGVLYGVTTMLSLLFHLPTTSAFQRKADEVAAIQSLTHLISQVFDLDKLSRTIVASPIDAQSGDVAWLMLMREGADDPLRVQAVQGAMVKDIQETMDVDALFAEVQETQDVLLLDEAPSDRRVRAHPDGAFESLLVVPLLARDDVLGALFVAKDVHYGFEKDDVEAIRVFAAQAALALDNARLFEERLEKERMHRELAIAREVQQKLLPQEIPSLRGTSIAASSVSAYEVGGDYYDFVRLDDDRIAFIVGDVAGKGTSGAFYMAEMQGIFRSLSRQAPEPREFLMAANRALCTTLDRRAFISVVYGVLDVGREEFRLARAGHCPAALIDLHGAARLLRSGGIGLGLNDGPLFEQSLEVRTERLQPGDVFVLYTDGVVESRNAKGEEYGYARLKTSLQEHRHEDADDLHEALLCDLHTFLGAETYDDDLTLVVVKWHGLPIGVPSPAPQASALALPS